METIIFTGGGSGGHLAPIRAVAPELKKRYQLIWLGSSHFEEKAAKDLDIEFKKIASGKMRRGFSTKNLIKNFIDLFFVLYGFFQSFVFLLRKRPKKIFSTGGFVSVPPVLSAGILGVPVIIHEQTIGFGLANKIEAYVAQKILLAFEDSKKYIPEKFYDKIEVVGNPVREELLQGSFEKLKEALGTDFSEEKPILYITGGGQGSQLINKVVFESLDELLQRFYVIHQAGKSGIKEAQTMKTSIRANTETESYFPFEFIGSELADIYASADLVLARAGAGTVNELDYFGIPSIFVPLQPVQNDEQMKNAQWFLRHNKGEIIEQNEFSRENLLEAISHFPFSKLRRKEERSDSVTSLSTQKILNFL